MRKKILIVGGAGYVGAHVNKKLAGNGAETIVLDDLSHGYREFVKWGEFVRGSSGDIKIVEKIFRENSIEAVMHFGANINVGESVIDPKIYYENNVKNTITLLNEMIKHGIKYFVFSSTAAIYGEPNKIPITEEHARNPINSYGRSKLMVEEILEDYKNAYDLEYVSLRYFNAAGADPDSEIGEWHEPETHLIPLVLDAAIGKKPFVEIFGSDYDTPDGTCVRDYIHVNDLAQAHIKALDHLRMRGTDYFNLGSEKGFSVKQIIEKAREVTGKDIKTRVTGRRPGDAPVLISSSDKARKTLGWEPEFKDIGRIIETAWGWHKNLSKRL